MSDEATEEKKGKKKKEKKPKKEKPPKEKKPKKEKPPKEKKPKKEKKAKGGDAPEGEKGAKKKKGPPLLLILVPVFVVVIVVVGLFAVRPMLSKKSAADAETELTEESPDALAGQMGNLEKAKGGKKDAEAEASADAESGEAEAEESAESGGADAEAEAGDESGDGGDGEASETPPKSEPVEMAVSMTRGEALDYFRSMPPSALGLSGESMDEYDIFPSENLVTVDGVPCREFRVYSLSGRAGTNDVQGLYLLTQSGARKLYRLDRSTNSVTEIKWSPPKPEPEPEPEEPLEGEAEPEAEETP